MSGGQVCRKALVLLIKDKYESRNAFLYLKEKQCDKNNTFIFYTSPERAT